MVDQDEMMRGMKERLGDGRGSPGHLLLTLSISGQPCDVTFLRSRPAALNVKIDQKISLALMYGAGARQLQKMLSEIALSDGQVVRFEELWLILPMPEKGFSSAELAAVDLSEGEKHAGPNGETLREMIRNIYHCESEGEEDLFLRRYLAS